MSKRRQRKTAGDRFKDAMKLESVEEKLDGVFLMPHQDGEQMVIGTALPDAFGRPIVLEQAVYPNLLAAETELRRRGAPAKMARRLIAQALESLHAGPLPPGLERWNRHVSLEAFSDFR